MSFLRFQKKSFVRFQAAGGANPLCDVREEISEENADQDYAAGEMNDIDGWD